ncbi:MAG: M28 family peptidase [Anaerolineae bacterium]|nr:M28 family peptidase [Anaerolineae bacterium]
MGVLLTIVQRVLNPRPDFSWLNKKPEKTEPRAKSRLRLRHLLSNFPLLLGSLIILGLFLMVLFGPLLAPENPYLAGQRSVTYQDGQVLAPPFPPSTDYLLGTNQWGKDILSLLLYGARNTLVACTFIAMARLLVGLILGALAGWHEGKLVDRLVMGGIGLTTALPILLSSMILIYALDIRRGLIVFIIAMSVVGWAEVAQYIRSEFIVLHQRSFIEGARVIGLPGLGIAVRHVLPNILPHLIVITLLEMSAVLILLGELGFIGVYIGGGATTTDFNDNAYTIPDIPEWGVMLADARLWARSKPWMVLYPALAFFMAVLGFNALAEGLRRLIEQVGLNTAFLLHKRMLVVIAVITLVTIYTVNNVGPAPTYARLAHHFNGESAYQHVQALTQLGNRASGQPGSQAAADYIAAQFKAYGLQPAGRSGSYFQDFTTHLVQPLEQPVLALLDENGQPLQTFRHQQDFGFVTAGHGGSGHAQAPLAFVGFHAREIPWDAYKKLDLSGRIALLLPDNAPPDFATEALIRGARGVLWIASDNPEAVHSQVQLADGDYVRRPTLPIFRIRPAVAEALLAPAGIDLDTLRGQVSHWPAGREEPWLVREVESRVQMSLALTEPQGIELVNVLGYLAGGDVALDDQLIVVAAHYDSLGQEPNGMLYPAANDNASGVAIMLEIARLWREQGLTPRRGVLFAAWVGGELEQSGAEAYFNGYLGGVSLLHPTAIFQLNNLGAGGDDLLIETNSEQLDNLLAESAAQVGLTLQRGGSMYHPYQTFVQQQSQAALISWAGSSVIPQRDVIERIEPEKLSNAGQTIILALTNAVRLPEY